MSRTAISRTGRWERIGATCETVNHPENIFENSVAQRSVDDYNCFLMTDRAAIEQAVHEGATRLTETDRVNPF